MARPGRSRSGSPETSPHIPGLPLTDEGFLRIVSATRLPQPARQRMARLRAEIERLRALWAAHTKGPRKVFPAREARRLRSISSIAERLAEALDTRALALLGDERDEALGGGQDAPSGFELASNDQDAVRRIARVATRASQRLDAQSRGMQQSRTARPHRSYDHARASLVAGLDRTFKRAFGRSLGASCDGPGIRFLRAFFLTCGERVSGGTAKRWVASAHNGPRSHNDSARMKARGRLK